jgi:hypothetical protein
MDIDCADLLGGLLESCAVMVKVTVPEAAGLSVPVTLYPLVVATPVNPAGKLGVTVYLYVGFPPVVVQAAEYGCPAVPAGKLQLNCTMGAVWMEIT